MKIMFRPLDRSATNFNKFATYNPSSYLADFNGDLNKIVNKQ